MIYVPGEIERRTPFPLSTAYASTRQSLRMFNASCAGPIPALHLRKPLSRRSPGGSPHDALTLV